MHGPQGFFLPNGYEFTLVLLAASIALVLQGAGAFALDTVVGRRAAAPHTFGTSAAAAR